MFVCHVCGPPGPLMGAAALLLHVVAEPATENHARCRRMPSIMQRTKADTDSDSCVCVWAYALLHLHLLPGPLLAALHACQKERMLLRRLIKCQVPLGTHKIARSHRVDLELAAAQYFVSIGCWALTRPRHMRIEKVMRW
jgi:hypothetical protein